MTLFAFRKRFQTWFSHLPGDFTVPSRLKSLATTSLARTFALDLNYDFDLCLDQFAFVLSWPGYVGNTLTCLRATPARVLQPSAVQKGASNWINFTSIRHRASLPCWPHWQGHESWEMAVLNRLLNLLCDSAELFRGRPCQNIIVIRNDFFTCDQTIDPIKGTFSCLPDLLLTKRWMHPTAPWTFQTRRIINLYYLLHRLG